MRRLREATAEIRKAARQDPVLAAEGAVTLIERLSPALEHVDSSSGAIGTAVNHAIAQLVPIVAAAPADAPARSWLARLWAALRRTRCRTSRPRRPLGRAVRHEARRLRGRIA
jgi:hypothetical protein